MVLNKVFKKSKKSTSKVSPESVESSEEKKGGTKKSSSQKSQPKKKDFKKEAEFYDKKSIIKRPWVSEKAYEMNESDNKYVFWVENKATKNQVKREVESRWDVSVKSVNMIRKKQRRRQWRGISGQQYTIKKAVVTVKGKDKIDIYPV